MADRRCGSLGAQRGALLVILCALGWLLGCGTASVPSAAPAATLNPTALSFPAATVGGAGTQSTVTLSNTGGQPLRITGMVLSDTSDYSVSSTCAASLGAGSQCVLAMQFEPKTAASLPATLTVTDNSGGSEGTTQTVSLSGTGISVPEPQSVLTPGVLSFAPTVLHNAAAAQVVSLSNTGTAVLQIGDVVLSDTADFTMEATTCGSALPAGSACSFTVGFQPQTVGPIAGSLTVTDDAGGVTGAQHGVALSGTGLPVPVPIASVAPMGLSFSSTVQGTSATAQALALSNSGNAPLVISAVGVNDTADYTVTSSCGAMLAAGSNCALMVSFHPQATGALKAVLTVTDNSSGIGGAQQTVQLSGVGLPIPAPQAELSPATLAFGTANVGTLSTAQMVSLRNSGTAPLLISGIALSDSQNFSLKNGCGTSLAPGVSCTLTVVFQPTTPGLLSANLFLSDNSGGATGEQQTVALIGTGMALPAPQGVFTPAALRFPATMVSLTSAAQIINLANAGNAPLVLGGVSLSDIVNFSLQSGCTGTLAPGASCALTITFQPQAVAAYSATLTVLDNSGASDATGAPTAGQTVSIGGAGIAFALPRASLSPGSLAFPQTVTNASAPVQDVTLTNTGTTPLTVANVALSGPSAAAFRIIGGGTCAGALAAGASCTVSVVYSPTLASTSDTALLVFTDDALGQSGSTQSVTLTGTALAEVDSVENFGDSITCGFYAMPNDGTGLVWSLEGYAGLFDTWLGVPAQDWCRQGDTAADLSRNWVPLHSAPAINGHQLFTLMIGANDAYRYGIPQDALSTYTATVGAALAWLAMPNTDKVLANAVTSRVGTWSADVGPGLSSTDAGASLSFPVYQAVAGRNLYVVYHVWDQPYGTAGKASIAVDGTVLATVDESSNSLVRLPTENGTTDTFVMQSLPLGAAGPHTVTFTSVGPSGSTVGLLWAGVPAQDYHAVDGAPRVLVGLITDSPSGNQTFAADNYNLQLKSLVPALNNDGMNIVLVPTDRVLDVNTDFADILHPNTAGHAKLAATFEQYR